MYISSKLTWSMHAICDLYVPTVDHKLLSTIQITRVTMLYRHIIFIKPFKMFYVQYFITCKKNIEIRLNWNKIFCSDNSRYFLHFTMQYSFFSAQLCWIIYINLLLFFNFKHNIYIYVYMCVCVYFLYTYMLDEYKSK